MNFQKLRSYKINHGIYVALIQDGIAYNNDDIILKITALWSSNVILVIHKSCVNDIELCLGVFR